MLSDNSTRVRLNFKIVHKGEKKKKDKTLLREVLLFFLELWKRVGKKFKQNFIAARNGYQKKEGNWNRPLFSDWLGMKH